MVMGLGLAYRVYFDFPIPLRAPPTLLELHSLFYHFTGARQPLKAVALTIDATVAELWIKLSFCPLFGGCPLVGGLSQYAIYSPPQDLIYLDSMY